MIIGAILQATAFSYAHMVVARIVTGLGNGLNVRTRAQNFRPHAVLKRLLTAAGL